MTMGMRAIRFLCISGEWVSDKWHLQGESSCCRDCTTLGPPDNPRMSPFRNTAFIAGRGHAGRLRRTDDGLRQDSRSKIIAMPWPPPTHMVSRPKVLSWNRRLFRSVEVIRAPVIPNG